MKHEIKVTGIKCYAFHGCLVEESRIGGNYIVDVDLLTDFSEAAIHDDLSQTIDYCDVALIVQQEMAIRSKLIEQVGDRIVRRLKKSLKTLHGFKLTITKLSPPIHGEVQSVSVVFTEGM